MGTQQIVYYQSINLATCFGSLSHHQTRWEPAPILSRSRQVAVTVSITPDTVDTVKWAPDDGCRYHPKHVEQFTDINKLYIVASWWIIIGTYCTMHGPLNIKLCYDNFLKYSIWHSKQLWHSINNNSSIEWNTLFILIFTRINCYVASGESLQTDFSKCSPNFDTAQTNETLSQQRKCDNNVIPSIGLILFFKIQ